MFHRKSFPSGPLTSIVIASIIIFTAAGSAFASDGMHKNTRTKTKLGYNNCNNAHNALKREIKDYARRHCQSSHKSAKINTLRQEHYTKISCQKNKEGSKTVSVKITGTLTWLCQ